MRSISAMQLSKLIFYLCINTENMNLQMNFIFSLSNLDMKSNLFIQNNSRDLTVVHFLVPYLLALLMLLAHVGLLWSSSMTVRYVY